MALQGAPLISSMEPSNSVPWSSDKHAQLLTAGNFEIISNVDQMLAELFVITSMILHKNNITETDDYQFRCEIFWSCSFDANQDRSTTGFQTFDTGQFLLSLQRTIKKFRKVLKIILLQFLTLSCRVVTKGHTYLDKPAVESCRFV